jgi:hypothetical protein
MMDLSYFKAVIGYAMQLCGARGAGQAAVRSLYWVANKGLSLMLVLESERERNAAILLARRFASNQNVSFVLLFFLNIMLFFSCLIIDYPIRFWFMNYLQKSYCWLVVV